MGSRRHVTEWVTVDVTRTLKLLEKIKSDKSFADVQLSPLLLIIRATLLSLARNPEANATWDDTASEIVQFRDVNLGIATATPRGLLVPNFRCAQALSTLDLAKALEDLIVQARAGKARVEAMQKGTFTITNIGVFNVDCGTPILNPGEAVILCVGAIRRKPWEHKGKIKLRSLCTLALSFDHRLIDGELGSRVLADIAHFLQGPALALTSDSA
jgi:pyruvate dehydrogenase E2 component (dihydrolipoamide acetyltransferase)